MKQYQYNITSRKDISAHYLQPSIKLLLSCLELNENENEGENTLSNVNEVHCSLLCLKLFLKYAHEEEMRVVIDVIEEYFVRYCEQSIESQHLHFKTRILLMKIMSQLCIQRLLLLYSDNGLVMGDQKRKHVVVKPQDEIEIPDSIADFLSNVISLMLSQLQENVLFSFLFLFYSYSFFMNSHSLEISFN